MAPPAPPLSKARVLKGIPRKTLSRFVANPIGLFPSLPQRYLFNLKWEAEIFFICKKLSAIRVEQKNHLE
jgi:hypothetical protein